MLRHGIVSATAPRIATQDAPNGEVESFDGAVFDEGLPRILGTGRGEAARRWCVRGNGGLVEANWQDEQPDDAPRDESNDFFHTSCNFSAIRWSSPLIRRSTSSLSRCFESVQTNAMTSILSGSTPSSIVLFLR